MFYIGLDLGQKRDHTAVVVVERIDHKRAFAGSAFEKLAVRYAERLPLGMPYPAIVARIREIVRCNDLLGKCVLAVDATGVGAPVVDMLRAAQLGCSVSAFVITGGDYSSGDAISKRDLMAEVLLLLEQRLLEIGKLKEGARLMKELTDIRLASHGLGRYRVGADGVGEHDDLAIALALACWRAKGGMVTVGERSQRLL
jgi:hypothetical protein